MRKMHSPLVDANRNGEKQGEATAAKTYRTWRSHRRAAARAAVLLAAMLNDAVLALDDVDFLKLFELAIPLRKLTAA